MSGRARARSWRGWTLRARIVTTTAIGTLIGMTALIAVMWLVLERTTDANVRSLLEDRADAVAGALASNDGDLADGVELGSVGDEVAWVFDASGTQVVGPSGSDLDRAAAGLAPAGARSLQEVGDWLLLAQPLTDPEGTVVVAASLDPYESTRDAALLAAGALGVLVVAAVTAGTAWTVTRALRPVTVMARDAATWSEQHLDRRFDLGPAHDEITELGATLDALLGRVARALLAEQRLTAELAHELRTPLTVVRAEAELAAGDPRLDQGQRARLERIVESTDHMASVIETLLTAAWGLAAADDAVPVRELFAAATTTPGFAPSPVPVVLADGQDEHVSTPLDVATRALSPLLANAVRHARSRVTVSASRTGASVSIQVLDDGPGVPPGARDAVFDPGYRGPDSPGAGLGLPLSRRVARAAGGDVRLDPDRPSCFVLTLPAAGDRP